MTNGGDIQGEGSNVSESELSGFIVFNGGVLRFKSRRLSSDPPSGLSRMSKTRLLIAWQGGDVPDAAAELQVTVSGSQRYRVLGFFDF